MSQAAVPSFEVWDSGSDEGVFYERGTYID
jgi:hypothetical protein